MSYFLWRLAEAWAADIGRRWVSSKRLNNLRIHVAAYISRLPAVNHHNGVLIMEIIARL